MKGRKWLWEAVLAGMFVALAPVCWAVPGDVDGLNGVELKDAVLSLKVAAGLSANEVTLDGDVDGDEAVGLAEAVFALWTVAVSGPGPGDSFTNSLGMTFVRIPAGTFMMGSPETEMGSGGSERPQHEVTLAQNFYIMTTEVTQAQWEAVMGNNPSYFDGCGEICPVEQVSWEDVQDFIAALNALDGRTYKLPTEAEWEYAARAETTTAFYNGDITEEECGVDPKLDAIGWYCGNSSVTYSGCYDASDWGGPTCAGTHPVAQKQPNAWGLYDMSGNVWEWVEDAWHYGYDGAPTDGSAWVDSPMGAGRVIRGGGWDYDAQRCRTARRYYDYPSDRYNGGGFRLALSPGR